MDASSLTPAPNRKEHTFTVEWDIHRIKHVLNVCDYPIFSHLIKIFHDGLSFWRLGIFSVRKGLKFFLIRIIDDAEEHDTIFVKFQLYLLNAKREVYFKAASDHLSYRNSSSDSMVKGQSFAHELDLENTIFIKKNSLEIRDHYLHVLCEMSLSIDDHESMERNSNDDLYYLHSDLDIFAVDDNFHDIILHSGRVHYGLYKTLLQARLPRFQTLVDSYDLVLKGLAAAGQKVKECPLWKKAKKPIPEKWCHVNDDILAEALYIVWSSVPTDPYIQPAQITIDILKQSFTPKVCQALISYLCTGSIELVRQHDVVHLSNIARCLSLGDLVHKLEGHPSGYHSLTEMIILRKKYRMRPLAFRSLRKLNYKPIVKTLILTDRTRKHDKEMILTIRFNRESEVMSLECHFSDTTAFPIPLLLTAKLTIKDSMGHSQMTSKRRQIYNYNDRWFIDVHIEIEKLAAKTVECMFYAVYNYETRLTCPPYERFQFDKTADISVWCPRRLSVDLYRSLKEQVTCDVMLVAQGKTLPAHIYILFSRSWRLMKEFHPKLNRGHMITYLVPGIEYRTLEEMVTYMYNGDLDLKNSDSVEKLLSAAEEFDVQPLVNSCKLFLENKNRR